MPGWLQELAVYAAIAIATLWVVARTLRRRQARSCSGCEAGDLERRVPQAGRRLPVIR